VMNLNISCLIVGGTIPLGVAYKLLKCHLQKLSDDIQKHIDDIKEHIDDTQKRLYDHAKEILAEKFHRALKYALKTFYDGQIDVESNPNFNINFVHIFAFRVAERVTKAQPRYLKTLLIKELDDASQLKLKKCFVEAIEEWVKTTVDESQKNSNKFIDDFLEKISNDPVEKEKALAMLLKQIFLLLVDELEFPLFDQYYTKKFLRFYMKKQSNLKNPIAKFSKLSKLNTVFYILFKLKEKGINARKIFSQSRDIKRNTKKFVKFLSQLKIKDLKKLIKMNNSSLRFIEFEYKLSIQNDKAFIKELKNIDGKVKNKIKELEKKSPNQFTCKVARKAEHMYKNNDNNILPYNWNLVKLHSDSDYINASIMKFPGQVSDWRAIAAQGPLVNEMGKENTGADFFSMIWGHELKHVVMLANSVEQQNQKCPDYLPELYKTKVFDFIKKDDRRVVRTDASVEVTLTSQIYLNKDITISELEIKMKRSERVLETFTTTHYLFKSWPEHGVPDTKPLLQLMEMILKKTELEKFLVHCNDGAGRTGTFLALYEAFKHLNKRPIEYEDIQEIVIQLRLCRMHMVENYVQYKFIYVCLLEYWETKIKESL